MIKPSGRAGHGSVPSQEYAPRAGRAEQGRDGHGQQEEAGVVLGGRAQAHRETRRAGRSTAWAHRAPRRAKAKASTSQKVAGTSTVA